MPSDPTHGLARERAGVAEAGRLLTRLPWPGWRAEPAVAAAWFPLLGALVGLAVAAALLVGGTLVDPTVGAVLAVAVSVWLTGALHLDGLADTADGSAGRTPADRLRIMRDHAVGVYGAAAVGLDILLTAALLAAVAGLPLTPAYAVAVVTGCYTLSRLALLVPALRLPYARAEGTGRGVVEGLTARRVLGAGVVTVVVVLLLVAGTGLLVLVALLWAGVAAVVTAQVVTVWARDRLGGATGDVLGATAELSLLAALAVALVLLHAFY